MTKDELFCGDCIHINACQAMSCGSMENTDATHCVNFTTPKDSTAYHLGWIDGKKDSEHGQSS